MLTFLLSTVGGALIGGSYILIRTPRSGKENQLFVKDFIQTTEKNIDNVSNQVHGLKQSLNNLNFEIQNIQEAFVPELLEITDDFKNHAEVSNRRIQNDLDNINRELNHLSK